MKQRKWNKKQMLVPVLLCLCLIGGVFAVFSQDPKVRNEFKTARYDTKIIVEFSPPTKWTPGQEVNKDVRIKNDGTVPVFTHVIISQEWTKEKSNQGIAAENPDEKTGREVLPLTFQNQGKELYAAEILWGDQVVLLESGKTCNAFPQLTTVRSVQEAAGKWILTSDRPDEEGNLHCFYIGQVPANDMTEKLVDAVRMNPAIEPKVLGRKISYNTADQKSVEIIENPEISYEQARYVLTVKAETVQATAEAVQEMFGKDEASTQIADYLSEYEAIGKSNPSDRREL